MKNNTFKHRETWLHAVAEALRPLFAATSHPIPSDIRLACGFPSLRGTAKNRRVGECWAGAASKDGFFEIMISPVVDDPMRVAVAARNDARSDARSRPVSDAH